MIRGDIPIAELCEQLIGQIVTLNATLNALSVFCDLQASSPTADFMLPFGPRVHVNHGDLMLVVGVEQTAVGYPMLILQHPVHGLVRSLDYHKIDELFNLLSEQST